MTSLQKKILEFIKLTDTSSEAMVMVNKQFDQMEKTIGMHLKAGWKKRVFKHLDPKVLTNRLMPVYGEHYSEEELDALIAFYKSKIGRKWMKTQKEVLPKVQGIFTKWLRELVLMAEQEMKDE